MNIFHVFLFLDRSLEEDEMKKIGVVKELEKMRVEFRLQNEPQFNTKAKQSKVTNMVNNISALLELINDSTVISPIQWDAVKTILATWSLKPNGNKETLFFDLLALATYINSCKVTAEAV